MTASRSPRRPELRSAAVLATLAALSLPLALAGPAIAAEKEPKPGTFRGGALVQDGWWSRSNESPPETGVAQPPSVPPVAAPAGTLPVAVINNEPERIVALEFGLKGGADAIVTEVLLVMAESEERGVQINSDLAALQACPVTEAFWVGVDNGAWSTAPVYDCEAGVAPGVRGKGGVWTFDLTALAGQWTSSDRTDSPAVVLVGAPPVDPADGASSFQVSFDGESGVGLAAKTTPAPAGSGDGDGGLDGGEGSEGAEGSGGSSTGSGVGASSGSGSVSSGGSSTGFGSSGGDDGGSLEPTDSGPLSSPDSSIVDGAEGEEAASAGGGIQPEAGAAPTGQSLVASTAGSAWYSGLGARSVALVVVAMMLAYLVMVSLGGTAQPVVGGQSRGVGRALERLRATRIPGTGLGKSPGSSSTSPTPTPTPTGTSRVITLEDRT